MELVPQRTTPNVTVDFAMEICSEPMEQNQWQAGGSSTDLSVPSGPRSRSNSCGMVEQLPLEELSYSQCHVLSVDTNLQRVCKALEDGLRLNVPQTGQHHGQLSAGDDEDDDCFVVGRPHSAMGSGMLQERRLSARTATGSVASSHHNRSQSVRAPKRPTYLSPPHSLRPRGTSFPGGGSEEDCYLLRHFIVSGKHVVNRGDSFRNRKTTRSSATSTSSASVENLVGSPPNQHDLSSSRASFSNMQQQQQNSHPHGHHPPFRVLMLGASGVGKTALTAQFMTSEYLNAYEASLDENSCDRSVSVLLDGEESELIFIDHPSGEISVENCMSTYSPHAYVVVFSVVNTDSIREAEDMLHFLWRSDVVSTHAVILVANKIDLVRSRVISTQDGKSLAVSFDCKYIETSSGIQHNVDELLVGILKQIRLKMSNPEQARSLFRKRSSRKKRTNSTSWQRNASSSSSGSGGAGGAGAGVGGLLPKTTSRSTSLKMRGLLGRVWCADYSNKSRSCEDLHVL